MTVAKLSDAKGVKRAFTIAPVLPGRRGRGAMAHPTGMDAEVRRRSPAAPGLQTSPAAIRTRRIRRTKVLLKSASQEPSFRPLLKIG